MVRCYMAPLEGITGYVYRNAFHRHFGGIDRYFTPFLTNRGLNHRERQDILPAHNQGMEVIPQILTNQADLFLELGEILAGYGYGEVNLNLGCPSGTVASKGRGSGFLARLPELERFLDEIFRRSPLPISIKTRIGFSSPEEWSEIFALLERYPMTELIIHPRVREDFYRNTPRREAYAYAYHRAKQPLCYNGDLFTPGDLADICAQFPNTGRVMLGRGLIANPWLALEMTGNPPVRSRDTLLEFCQEILEGYRAQMSGERPVLFHLKELWSYLSNLFEEEAVAKPLKRLRKANGLAEYQQAAEDLIAQCPFRAEGSEAWHKQR